jgi:hypothetical protein
MYTFLDPMIIIIVTAVETSNLTFLDPSEYSDNNTRNLYEMEFKTQAKVPLLYCNVWQAR